MPSQKDKIIFQASFFRGQLAVKLRVCLCPFLSELASCIFRPEMVEEAVVRATQAIAERGFVIETIWDNWFQISNSLV